MTKAPASAPQHPVENDPLFPDGAEEGGQAPTETAAPRQGRGAAPGNGTAKASPEQLLRMAFARASQVFGQTVSLFMQSPQHRHLLLSDLEWRVIPPIALQQYRLVQHKGAPAGFISWALVDEETEQRLQQPDFRLRPQDWKRGERVWIIDVVAPAAQAEALIEKVKAELFEGREVRVREDALSAPANRSDAMASPVVGDEQ
jgi:cytolysin-activating lysine-acyltransferase